jgi:hypothetical protein
MADQSSSNQTTMYILVGVVVLLVAVVGYMFYARNQPAATTNPAITTGASTTGGSTTGQQAATVDPSAPVDTKTATKVTGGDPKAFVSNYYAAVTKKDWATAYKLLPYSVKSQQDEASWGQTQAGYGIKGFTVKSSDIKGDTATVVVSMDTASYGTFSNTWTFKKVGDSWYVLNKKTAMGQ